MRHQQRQYPKKQYSEQVKMEHRFLVYFSRCICFMCRYIFVFMKRTATDYKKNLHYDWRKNSTVLLSIKLHQFLFELQPDLIQHHRIILYFLFGEQYRKKSNCKILFNANAMLYLWIRILRIKTKEFFCGNIVRESAFYDNGEYIKKRCNITQ